MKKLIITLLLIIMTLNFASCGDSQTKEQESIENKQKVTDKANDTFYISGSIQGKPDKIPWIWQNGEGLIPYMLYRCLLISDGDFANVKPDLVKSFDVSEDELTYTYVLDDDLKWSDGEKITPEDVKFSVELALKVSLINGIFPENLLKIEGAKDFKDGKVDTISGINIEDNKITMKLNEPVGLFNQIIGAQFFIFPKHSLENENPLEIHNSEFWKNPVTSGMYKIKQLSAGNFIEFEKNQNYNKEVNIEKVVFTFIEDSVLAMKDDMSYFYSTNSLQEIKELDKITKLTKNPIDILFYRYLIANLSGLEGNGDSLVVDKKVREAILYAIDREGLANSLLEGVAKVANSGVLEGADEYLNSQIKYEYNPEKAKQLLNEANFKQSRPLKLTYYYKDQASNDLMQAISYQLDQVGIKNEVIQIQTDPTTGLFKTRKYDLGYKGFSSFAYESWYGEYSSSNTNFKNIYNSDDSFDNLLHKLASTSNSEKRKDLLKELQTLEQDKLLKLPLYTISNFVYINNEKVETPSDLKLLNPFYRFDYKFEQWKLK